MLRISTGIIALSLIGCASGPTQRAVSSASSGSSPASSRSSSAADEDTLQCHTPGIMDSGYSVSIASEARGSNMVLFGTIATISGWGTDRKLYEGPFAVQVSPDKDAKSCFAHLKAQNKPAEIMASTEGRKSSMTLTDGGVAHELTCKFPKPLLESLEKCQASLKK